MSDTTSGRPVATRNNTLATVGFILALLGISLPAAICGHVARSQIERSGGVEINRWMATAAIIIGWIGVAAYTLLIIVAVSADSGSSSYYYSY